MRIETAAILEALRFESNGRFPAPRPPSAVQLALDKSGPEHAIAARQGVRSVVLEADDTVCVGSRAICISRRSLEIVEKLGALPAFLAKGLPWTT